MFCVTILGCTFTILSLSNGALHIHTNGVSYVPVATPFCLPVLYTIILAEHSQCI